MLGEVSHQVSKSCRCLEEGRHLLGAEQHGHMAAVGYELYAKLLAEAVSIERGDKERLRFDTSVDISMKTFAIKTNNC